MVCCSYAELLPMCCNGRAPSGLRPALPVARSPVLAVCPRLQLATRSQQPASPCPAPAAAAAKALQAAGVELEAVRQLLKGSGEAGEVEDESSAADPTTVPAGKRGTEVLAKARKLAEHMGECGLLLAQPCPARPACLGQRGGTAGKHALLCGNRSGPAGGAGTLLDAAARLRPAPRPAVHSQPGSV